MPIWGPFPEGFKYDHVNDEKKLTSVLTAHEKVRLLPQLNIDL